ncbi:MAG TPA: hypothetical protein VGF69_04195 [Thermoanaerobaculia bacterium]|jgi:hypothetical protein
MLNNVQELRRAERFIVIDTLAGSFGATEIRLVDIGAQGVQIAHAQPLRLGTRARLWFRRADVTVATHATVVWSRLSKSGGYQSGLRLEANGVGHALESLTALGTLRRDAGSLERKRERLLEKQQARAAQPKLIRHADVYPEQELLIQHARARLSANPDEATKWYNRARFAVSQEAELIHHREEVLAVWEYLERTVDIATIVKVFARR